MAIKSRMPAMRCILLKNSIQSCGRRKSNCRSKAARVASIAFRATQRLAGAISIAVGPRDAERSAAAS